MPGESKTNRNERFVQSIKEKTASLASSINVFEDERYLAATVAVCRPALRLQDMDSDRAGAWRETLTLAAPMITLAAAAVGRLDAPGELFDVYATAFLVSPDLVMTTRQAIENFAVGVGTAGLQFKPGRSATVDFGEGRTCQVVNIVMVHPVLDIGLLRILPQATLPLRLRASDPAEMNSGHIAVIGFPKRDRRFNSHLQDLLFDGGDGIKRVLPGITSPPSLLPMLGRRSLSLVYDTAPLQGLVGAPVIDLATGHVVGVQFASRDMEGCYAVPCSEFARDRRVAAFDLLFQGAIDNLPPQWEDAWSEVDGTSSHAPAAQLVPAPDRAPESKATEVSTVQRMVEDRFSDKKEFREFLNGNGYGDVVRAVPERASIGELVRALQRRGQIDQLLNKLNPVVGHVLDVLSSVPSIKESAALESLSSLLRPESLTALANGAHKALSVIDSLLQSFDPQGPVSAPAARPLTMFQLSATLATAQATALVDVHQNGQRILSASGWLLTPTLVVTAAHPLDEHVQAIAEFESADGAHRKFNSVKTWCSSLLDLALLRLSEAFEGPLPMLAVAPEDVARPVICIHYGQTRRTTMVVGELLAYEGPTVMYNIDTSSGSSGAPILNSQSQVIATHRLTLKRGETLAHIGTVTTALLDALRDDPQTGGALWREVLGSHPELRVIPATLKQALAGMSLDDRLPVVIQLIDLSSNQLPAIDGLAVHASQAGLLTGVASRNAIEMLLRHPQVMSVEASLPTAAPECAQSVPHTGAVAVHVAPPGEEGKDALIAIIDNGIDVMHKAFRDGDVNTRIVAYWDQHDTRSPASEAAGAVWHSLASQDLVQRLGLKYGALYAQEDIQSFIGGAQMPPTMPRAALTLHGTLVASIAAGQPCGTGPEAFAGGVAPKALLIVVRYDLQDASLGYSKGHIDALDFIDRFATVLERPVVVNISNGMNAGSHDGTTTLEKQCNAFTRNGDEPGRIIVKSAGNERTTNRHARLTVRQGSIKYLPWRSQPQANAPCSGRTETIELWFDAMNQYRFVLRGPGQPLSVVSTFVDSQQLPFEEYLPNGNLVKMQLHPYHSDNSSGSLTILISPGNQPAVETGQWSLEITGEKVTQNKALDAWVDEVPGRDISFTDFPDDQVTVTIPGTAEHVICVGATEVGPLMKTFSRSSWGPTRKGLEKPDIMAPGVALFAAGATTGERRTPVAQSGTSLAAPHVAGAIALALSACYRTRRPFHRSHRVLQAIRATARHGGSWSEESGWGELDAKAFYDNLLI